MINVFFPSLGQLLNATRGFSFRMAARESRPPLPFTFNVKIRLKRLSISILIRRRQFRDIRTTLLYMCTCTGLSEHSTAVCCPSLNGSLLARPLGDYCMNS